MYNPIVILNVYKEKDWTSFDVVAKLRGVLKTKKVGHAGTLDPLAEGVLLVLTEKDTKKQNDLMELEKEYVAKIGLGASSSTYDLEGELEFCDVDIPHDILEVAEQQLTEFVGVQQQTVPMFSAKKVKGKPLYKQAHSGKILPYEELPKKEVEIYGVEVLGKGSIELENRILPVLECKIVCSKGTYIRSIAHDLGKKLGTGGVLTGLIRTRIGDYFIEDSKKVSDIEDQYSPIHQR